MPRVRPLSFHDLRRSHASLLAASNVTLTHAQRLMRHSDPRLTQDLYTVADVEALRPELERMSFRSRVASVGHSRAHGKPKVRGPQREPRGTQQSDRGSAKWLGPESNREPTDYEGAHGLRHGVSPGPTARNLEQGGVSVGVTEATESHPHVPTVSRTVVLSLWRRSPSTWLCPSR